MRDVLGCVPPLACQSGSAELRGAAAVWPFLWPKDQTPLVPVGINGEGLLPHGLTDFGMLSGFEMTTGSRPTCLLLTPI